MSNCEICGEPCGDHPGAKVYHAVCLKEMFPNSTLHLERLPDGIDKQHDDHE